MIYFPTNWGAKESQNFPNDRVVIVITDVFLMWLPTKFYLRFSSTIPSFPRRYMLIHGGVKKMVNGNKKHNYI